MGSRFCLFIGFCFNVNSNCDAGAWGTKSTFNKTGSKNCFILLFEDLLIVPLLAVITFLSPFERESQIVWWQSALIAMVALGTLVFIGRFILNPVFKILANSKAREVMTAAALFVVLGSGLLMEEAGLSMAMGAFVAGVMLSESSFRHQLEADIEPFRGLLLGLFFLGVGMSLISMWLLKLVIDFIGCDFSHAHQKVSVFTWLLA